MADRQRPDRSRNRRDDRAVTPIVGKALEAAIVVLFIGVVTTGLYAGVVPDYRSATAGELGDRTLVAAVNEVEAAVPPYAERVHAERRVDLPTTLRAEGYRIVASSGPEGSPTLELRHPHPAVGGERPLALPDAVTVEGSWTGGGGRLVVESAATGEGLVVRLEADP